MTRDEFLAQATIAAMRAGCTGETAAVQASIAARTLETKTSPTINWDKIKR